MQRLSLILACALLPACLSAQGSADVPLGDNAYVYLDALLARGAMRSLSALERPYNVAEIDKALAHEMPAHMSPVIQSYVRALRRALSKYEVTKEPGLHYQLSLDVYGTAESSSIRELMRANTSRSIEPGGGGDGLMQVGPMTAYANVIWDGRLNVDPEYHLPAGDIVQGRANPVRIQEGYLDARWRYGEIFIGREGRNSGPTMYDGLLLGNYTYSYDHLYGWIGIPQLRMQALVTRLNDEFYGGNDTTVQRFFSWHRLSSHIKNVEIGVTESIVYGRPGQSFVFNYVNPFGLYYFSEINEEQGGTNANKMVGLDGAWRSAVGNFSFEAYLDDIQAFGGCGGMELECKKPPSGGWTLQADGIPFIGDQRLFAAYTLVTNLSYRTFEQPWTDYTSYGISLGRGFSDYDEFRAGIDLAAIPAVPLKVYAAYSRQGQGDYRIPFPAVDSFPTTKTFLSGIVSHVYRGGVSGAVSLPWLDINGDIGLNHVSNYQHIAGVDKTLFAGRVMVSLTWRKILSGVFQPAPEPPE